MKESNATVRLQKFLSECGVASRRASEELILEGKVKVNNQVVKVLGTKIDPDHDRVQVRNKLVRPPHKGLILFHKPKGVVSTLHDPEGRRSIADYLTKHIKSYFPVGRLDWDSSGLMILTNDGAVAERLMHPRYGFERTYHVRVEGNVNSGVLDKLARGVRLKDGVASAKATLVPHLQRGTQDEGRSTWLEVQVSEGRNRLIRRLFERVECPVMKLKRIQYGPFHLGKLKPGEMRALTQKEYMKYRKIIMRTGEER